MKDRRVATVVVLLCVLRLPGWSQDQEKGHGVASKPQLQVFFSKLETQWFNAIQDKDPGAPKSNRLGRLSSVDTCPAWEPNLSGRVAGGDFGTEATIVPYPATGGA